MLRVLMLRSSQQSYFHSIKFIWEPGTQTNEFDMGAYEGLAAKQSMIYGRGAQPGFWRATTLQSLDTALI